MVRYRERVYIVSVVKGLKNSSFCRKFVKTKGSLNRENL